MIFLEAPSLNTVVRPALGVLLYRRLNPLL